MVRSLAALGLPLLVALVLAQATAGTTAGQTGRNALILGGLGVVSWVLGLLWYRLPGMGLRGRRPLYAGIGFATLGWVVILLARFLVPSETITNASAASIFIYLLLFESFCVQLWAFGLFFRSVADWRGPLSAVLASGVAFGFVALLLFRESIWGTVGDTAGWLWTLNALSFFLLWGFFYGLIRLRTGSLLGSIIIQALQSFTVWNILTPASPPSPGGYQRMYLVASVALLVLIWRLWPKEEGDYRV
jgi:hypothetical protein